MDIKKKKRTALFGKKISLKQAHQPYQYNWENMAKTIQRRLLGFFMSMVVLMSFLAIAFFIQFKMQKTVAYFDNFEKTDCNVFKDSIAMANDEHGISTNQIFIIKGFS
jgi:hypothetical protein